MNNFNDLFNMILSQIESNPNDSIEEVIEKMSGDMDLSSEEMSEIEESFKTLDAINEKSKALEEAREEGRTRIGWIEDQVDKLSTVSGLPAEEIISEINKGADEALNNTLNQEL